MSIWYIPEGGYASEWYLQLLPLVNPEHRPCIRAWGHNSIYIQYTWRQTTVEIAATHEIAVCTISGTIAATALNVPRSIILHEFPAKVIQAISMVYRLWYKYFSTKLLMDIFGRCLTFLSALIWAAHLGFALDVVANVDQRVVAIAMVGVALFCCGIIHIELSDWFAQFVTNTVELVNQCWWYSESSVTSTPYMNWSRSN